LSTKPTLDYDCGDTYDESHSRIALATAWAIWLESDARTL